MVGNLKPCAVRSPPPAGVEQPSNPYSQCGLALVGLARAWPPIIIITTTTGDRPGKHRLAGTTNLLVLVQGHSRTQDFDIFLLPVTEQAAIGGWSFTCPKTRLGIPGRRRKLQSHPHLPSTQPNREWPDKHNTELQSALLAHLAAHPGLGCKGTRLKESESVCQQVGSLLRHLNTSSVSPFHNNNHRVRL